MQLYVINWSFENAEDQLFATREFCEFSKSNAMNELSEGLELEFIAHTPQDGSGTIICRAQNLGLVYDLLKMWRENYSISFNIKPAFTNKEFIDLHLSD